MRSKLPRRGENSADCAKRNQASESILELKNRHKKKGKARGVLDIRESFARKQSRGVFQSIATATRFGVTNAKVYFIRSEARL